jgi:hypothetical protein
VEFDYPWSQQPVYPFACMEPQPMFDERPTELETIEGEPMGPSASKPRTLLKR